LQLSFLLTYLVSEVDRLVHEDHLELDHLFIWVASDAPEKSALAKAGFKLDEEVNVHHGQ